MWGTDKHTYRSALIFGLKGTFPQWQTRKNSTHSLQFYVFFLYLFIIIFSLADGGLVPSSVSCLCRVVTRCLLRMKRSFDLSHALTHSFSRTWTLPSASLVHIRFLSQVSLGFSPVRCLTHFHSLARGASAAPNSLHMPFIRGRANELAS